MIALCYATEELIENAPALDQYLRTAFADEFAFMLDDAVINGTGAGQPLGIMNAGSMVQVSKEGSQVASTIVYENILKMWARLIPSAMPDSVWLVNGNCFPQLGQMSLSVGSGGSAVYVPAGGASSAPFGSLMGRPIIPIEQCQTVGTSGDIILANFKKGYLLADKGGIKHSVSVQIRFNFDEQVFKATMRCDGSPLLKNAITPFKGSDTVSHFIKLQTRD